MPDMKFNLHTHTTRCGHADGEDREYVEAAVAAGFHTLGFADHVPIPFPDGYRSGCRMDVSETKGYVASLVSLREEFAGKIELLVGYEAEFMPFLFVHMMQNLVRQERFDYLILGQHFWYNEFDGHGATRACDSEEHLSAYTDTLIKGMETGCYTYVAHPDIFRFSGELPAYERQVRRLCEASKRLNIPLELNFTGLEEGRHYPREDFWRIAGEVGCPVTWGADSHSPSLVYRPTAIRMANEYIEKFALRFVAEPTIRDPKAAFDKYLKSMI